MAKILIVEDDARTSTAVARLFTGKGHTARVESNGAAALLAAHDDLPDCIIMDLMMPILDGHETIHALRHDPRTAHIPIVVLSGRDDDRTLAEALSDGANVYLTKPPEPVELLTIVSRLATLRGEDAGEG